MDGTFVNAIAGNARNPQEIDGKVYLPQGWTRWVPPKPNLPEPISVCTLTGIKDYLERNVDVLEKSELMLVVQGPGHVDLISESMHKNEHHFRHVHLAAGMVQSKFAFNSYLDAESFFVGLQTQFVPGSERDALLATVASIRDHSVTDVFDDGVAQEVKTARGVLVDKKLLPSLVMLSPYRTFREIEQPSSLFVLRLKSGREGEKPTCALFEADGGMWLVDSIQRIAAWLRQNISDVAVIA